MTSRVTVRVVIDGWETLAMVSTFADRETAEQFAKDMRRVIDAVGTLSVNVAGGTSQRDHMEATRESQDVSEGTSGHGGGDSAADGAPAEPPAAGRGD